MNSFVAGADAPGFLVWNRRQWLVGLAVAFVGIVALLPYRHFLSDDGYIYLRYLRNFTATGALAFNDGIPTYGMTGPLWILVLAPLDFLIRDPFVTAKIVSFFLTACSIVLFHRLASLYLRGAVLPVLASCALFLEPWFAKWMLSGLENPLTMALLFLSFLLYLTNRNSGRTPHLAYLGFGLLVLCRPEALLLVPLVLSDLVFFERRKRRQNLVAAAAYAISVVGSWAVFTQLYFGGLIPNPVLAKQAEVQHMGSHIETFKRCAILVGASGAPHFAAIAAMALLAATRRRGSTSFKATVERWYLLLAWGLGLWAFYVAGKALVSGRYLIPVIAIVNLLGFAALDWIIRSLRVRRWLVLAPYAAVLLALLVTLQWRYTYFVTAWPQGMDPRLVEIAVWMRDNTAPDAVVAATEIGVLGYYSDRTVLDVSGLCSPDVLPHIRNRTVDAYLYAARPDYLMIDKELSDPALKEISELIMQRLVQREGTASLGKLIPYDLYRLHFSNGPRPATGAAAPSPSCWSRVSTGIRVPWTPCCCVIKFSWCARNRAHVIHAPRAG